MIGKKKKISLPFYMFLKFFKFQIGVTYNECARGNEINLT